MTSFVRMLRRMPGSQRIASFAPARLLLAASMCLAAPAVGFGQELPAGPIRIVVGLAAGGATDAVARVVGQKLSETLHATVIVENRPGGNFIPAGKEVMSAAPDGNTLYMISTSNLVTQPLFSNYPLDLREFTAVTEVASGP